MRLLIGLGNKLGFVPFFSFFPFPVPDDNALLTHMYNQAEFYWCSFTVLQPVLPFLQKTKKVRDRNKKIKLINW